MHRRTNQSAHFHFKRFKFEVQKISVLISENTSIGVDGSRSFFNNDLRPSQLLYYYFHLMETIYFSKNMKTIYFYFCKCVYNIFRKLYHLLVSKNITSKMVKSNLYKKWKNVKKLFIAHKKPNFSWGSKSQNLISKINGPPL